MVKVVLKGHEEYYDVLDIVRIFYPLRDIDIEKEIKENGFYIVSEVDESAQELKVFIYSDGRIVKLEKRKIHEEVDKNLIRKILYETLRDFTGKESPWGTLTGIRPIKLVRRFLKQGYGKEEIVYILRKEYLLSRQKAELLVNIALNTMNLFKEDVKNKISLYISIPFCPTRCSYCTFPSYSLSKYGDLIQNYLNALKKEIRTIGEYFSKLGYSLYTIYIGGGTPTVLDGEKLSLLIEEIYGSFICEGIKEFTLEAGRPDTIDKNRLLTAQKMGVNRISINPQTMNKETLKRIGRSHSPEDVIKAYYMARDMEFNNINMDLIIGLPGEDIDDFSYTLEKIKEMKPDSLTVHSLSLKKTSDLRQKIAEGELISLDIINQMSELAQEFTFRMGMKPYYLYRQKFTLGNLENIGYSFPGYEGLYNILMIEDMQYIVALGAGSVSKFIDFNSDRIERIDNAKDLQTYIMRIDEMIERKIKFFERNLSIEI